MPERLEKPWEAADPIKGETLTSIDISDSSLLE